MKEPLGIYLHVPFCASHCPYCDFYTKLPGENEIVRYVARMTETIRNDEHKGLRADSVYLGGGTPSVLSGDQLTALLTAIRETFDVAPDAEITLECNPSSDLEHVLPAAAAAGVNRVSLGMQSAVDIERKRLGRRADRKRVEEALSLARASGITNLTLDVMLGVPGQTLQSLEETLSFLKDSGVPHVSAYLLKLEEGTWFYEHADRLDLPEEETVSAMYLRTCEALEEAGLAQYEISNFARPGFESRHNLKYWRCEEYLGFGPAAHSYFAGRRFYQPTDLSGFLDSTASSVDDGPGGSFEERLMLALRLTEGYTGPLPEKTRQKVAESVLRPYVELTGDTLRLTREGFLVSNTVISELL